MPLEEHPRGNIGGRRQAVRTADHHAPLPGPQDARRQRPRGPGGPFSGASKVLGAAASSPGPDRLPFPSGTLLMLPRAPTPQGQGAANFSAPTATSCPGFQWLFLKRPPQRPGQPATPPWHRLLPVPPLPPRLCPSSLSFPDCRHPSRWNPPNQGLVHTPVTMKPFRATTSWAWAWASCPRGPEHLAAWPPPLPPAFGVFSFLNQWSLVCLSQPRSAWGHSSSKTHNFLILWPTVTCRAPRIPAFVLVLTTLLALHC